MTALGIILIVGSVLAFWGGVAWLVVSLIRQVSVRRSLGLMLLGPILLVVGIIFLAVSSADDDSSIVTSSSESTSIAQAAPASSTPDPRKVGKDRTTPVPFGDSVIHSDLEITVLEVQRNHPTDTGPFTKPKEGHEWVTVTLRIRNVSGKATQTKRYYSSDFRITGDRGTIYNGSVFEAKTDTPLGSGEFFGGAEVVGDVTRQVHEDDTGLVLIFSPAFQGSRYLSLE